MKEKGTILIVDDSKALQSLISEMLQSKRYSTFSVDSGEDAMVFLASHNPELILLDRNMLGMDGFEVCKRIKANKKLAKIPIIFLTASNDTKAIVEGFKLGAVDYITKPFQKEELLARVNSHMELYKLSKLLKEQAEELKESEKNLTDINATKDKFFSIIAHDLKGPFNNILELSRLLRDKFEENNREMVVELIQHLNTTAENTQDLLLTLLDWALVQRGKMPYNPEKLQLNLIVNDCLSMLGSNARSKSIILENSLTETIAVYADENMLKTILRNLLSNAIKFTPKGGTISVQAKPSINTTEICVADCGVGIDPKTLKNLFVINSVQSTYGTEGEPGTGLGLLLCKEFVVKHGGNIWAESEQGKGSKFKFSLPVN